jgi:hypothetical protein
MDRLGDHQNYLQMEHSRGKHGIFVSLEQLCLGQFLSCCSSFGSSA